MEIILFVSKKDFPNAKNMLLTNDTVSRASIVFKEASSLGYEEEGYYCYVSGSEEACKEAKNITKKIATIPKNSKEIIKKIKEEEAKAAEGFGNIFG